MKFTIAFLAILTASVAAAPRPDSHGTKTACAKNQALPTPSSQGGHYEKSPDTGVADTNPPAQSPATTTQERVTIDPETGKKVHHVTVGGIDILRYEPGFVRADTGDIVRFTFLARNHTATESTFDTPCAAKADGNDSGFVPNLDNDPNLAGITFDVDVENQNPRWFYCRQGNHCGQGMVFAINPEKAASPPPPAGQVDPAKTYIKFVGNAISSGCPAVPAPAALT